jgi:hypothetical protein
MNHKTIHRNRLIRSAVALIAGASLAIVVPAGAATSITPNPIPVSPGQQFATVTFTYSGLPANKRLFITQCRKPHSDPTFNPFNDCSNLSEITINPVDNPTGSGTYAVDVFRGAEPSTDVLWGCFAPGDSTPAGYERYDTCYLRITADTQANNIDAQSSAFTFVVEDPEIPEAPLAIALPLLAAAVIGGGILISRRRTATA